LSQKKWQSTSAATEFSISVTANIVDNARQNGLTCIPLNLTHRPQDQQLLKSDLALLIYTQHPKDGLVNILRGAARLRSFVSEALMSLDHKVALYANAKRTGRLTSEGTWHNSFRSASLNPEKLCAYLSRLIYRYVLIEVGYVTGGNFSRMAWDRSGMLPGMYYGQAMLDLVYPHQEFQFGDFECI
jgi:hypothetical protein